MFEVAFSQFLSPKRIMDLTNMRKLQDDDICFVKSYFKDAKHEKWFLQTWSIFLLLTVNSSEVPVLLFSYVAYYTEEKKWKAYSIVPVRPVLNQWCLCK